MSELKKQFESFVEETSTWADKIKEVEDAITAHKATLVEAHKTTKDKLELQTIEQEFRTRDEQLNTLISLRWILNSTQQQLLRG